MESCTVFNTFLVFNALLLVVNGAPLTTTDEDDTYGNGSSSNNDVSKIPDMTKNALKSSLPILRFINSKNNFKVNFKEPNSETTPTIHIIDMSTPKNDEDILKKKEAARRFSNAFDSILSGPFGDSLKFGDRLKSRRIYPTTKKSIDSFNREKLPKEGRDDQSNSNISVISNKSSDDFFTQTQHGYRESGKFADNGSPRAIIESESAVSHTEDHDSVVSQGHEESKNKQDSQQTLSLNVTAIIDNDNNKHVYNNGKYSESKSTGDKFITNIFTPTNNTSILSKNIDFNGSRPLEVMEYFSKSSPANVPIENHVLKSDESNIQINALDIYSKLSEIENVLNGKDSSQDGLEKTSNKPSIFINNTNSVHNFHRKNYDAEINSSNKTRTMQMINNSFYFNNSAVLPVQNISRPNEADSTELRSRGSSKYFQRSTTEKNYKYYEDLAQQNYPKETIERLKLNKLIKSNGEVEKNPVETIQIFDTRDIVSTVKPVTKENNNLQWIMVKTLAPTNIEKSRSDSARDKNDKSFNNRIDRSRNNDNKNITDSKIVTIAKLGENINENAERDGGIVSTFKEMTNDKFNNQHFNSTENQASLSVKHTDNQILHINNKTSGQNYSLDSGTNKDLGENLEQTIILDSNNDGFVLDTEESSYYGNDGSTNNHQNIAKSSTQPDKNTFYEISTISSNRDKSEGRQQATNTDRLSVNLNSGSLERGSRKFSATKFETISPYITDSMTNKLYGTAKSQDGFDNYNPQALAGNDLPADIETPKNFKPGKPYRGSIKYKYEPRNYDWSEDSDEINNYPAQFEYTYKAPNDTDVHQKGFLKRINNRKVFVVHGSYKYTAPDGTPIFVSYTADEYGFHPQETKYFETKAKNLETSLERETVDELIEDTKSVTPHEEPEIIGIENTNSDDNI